MTPFRYASPADPVAQGACSFCEQPFLADEAPPIHAECAGIAWSLTEGYSGPVMACPGCKSHGKTRYTQVDCGDAEQLECRECGTVLLEREI